jgi:hypothetical protein
MTAGFTSCNCQAALVGPGVCGKNAGAILWTLSGQRAAQENIDLNLILIRAENWRHFSKQASI